MPATDLLSRLQGVRPAGKGRWTARCPAHQDRSPSLAITEVESGKVLVHCFAECPVQDVLAAIGLEMDALFPPKEATSGPTARWQGFSPTQVLRATRDEAVLVLVAARAIAAGQTLDPASMERLVKAAGRLYRACDLARIA
jgi:hypothetical protein